MVAFDDISSAPAAAARLPTAGETVEIQGLVSAPHLNGKRGQVAAYVTKGKNVHRYNVNLTLDDGTKKSLAVKPPNIALLPSPVNSIGSSIRGDDSFYYRRDWEVVHVLVPCHVSDGPRRDRFEKCVNSLSRQSGRCRVFVSVSGPAAHRQAALGCLRAAAAASDGGQKHQWIFLEHDASEQKSQFQHLKSLLEASLSVNPDAWLMFLDNDDMYHPRRVEFFQEKVAVMKKQYPTRKAFCNGAKLLVNKVVASSRFGPGAAFDLDTFVNGNATMNGMAEIKQTVQENGACDTIGE